MKPKFLKVENEKELYRDSSSNAILNLDDSAYLRHKQSKEFAKRKREEENKKEVRLNNLEKDVQSLKVGIQQILELLKNDK